MFRTNFCLDSICLYSIVFLIFLSINFLNAEDADDAQPKRTYGGVQGFFPFPRNGRSDPLMSNWDNAFEEYQDYLREYPQHFEILKRQGLMPFPRVGRSGSDKASLSAENAAALWFGPRLGRIQKRSNSLQDNSNNANNKPEIFTPRLGRESSGEKSDNFNIYFAYPANEIF